MQFVLAIAPALDDQVPVEQSVALEEETGQYEPIGQSVAFKELNGQ